MKPTHTWVARRALPSGAYQYIDIKGEPTLTPELARVHLVRALALIDVVCAGRAEGWKLVVRAKRSVLPGAVRRIRTEVQELREEVYHLKEQLKQYKADRGVIRCCMDQVKGESDEVRRDCDGE